MSDYCASNLERPSILQTWFYDAPQGKLVPGRIGGNFTYNLSHSQFDISTRNGYKSIQVVTSSGNPHTVTSGGLYIAADDTTRVEFLLPLSSGSMVYGDTFRFAGYGAAGYKVSVVSPGQGQSIEFAGFGFHTLQNIGRYDQISFLSNQFNTNNFFYSFAAQGNFTGT